MRQEVASLCGSGQRTASGYIVAQVDVLVGNEEDLQPGLDSRPRSLPWPRSTSGQFVHQGILSPVDIQMRRQGWRSASRGSDPCCSCPRDIGPLVDFLSRGLQPSPSRFLADRSGTFCIRLGQHVLEKRPGEIRYSRVFRFAGSGEHFWSVFRRCWTDDVPSVAGDFRQTGGADHARASQRAVGGGILKVKYGIATWMV